MLGIKQWRRHSSCPWEHSSTPAGETQSWCYRAGHRVLNPCSCCFFTKSCLTLGNLMGCSLTGSSVHGIFQARILGWVAISASMGSSQPRHRTHVSCISCIGRQILYHCTTWEGWCLVYTTSAFIMMTGKAFIFHGRICSLHLVHVQIKQTFPLCLVNGFVNCYTSFV